MAAVAEGVHTGGLTPRPSRGLGAWWTIALGVALAGAGLALMARLADRTCAQLHAALELAGSDQRLATWIPGCPADLGAARASLGWDLLLIAGYVTGAAAVLRRWWPLYQATRLKALERIVITLPAVVGGLDVIENALILVGLDTRNGRFAYPTRMALPVTIATVSWLKWIAGGIVVVTVVMAVMLAAARRGEAARPAVAPMARPESTPAEPTGLGICCSGGGIRAAAFALGALDRLEHAGVTSRACWLSSVSGGSYAATAWSLVRASDPARPAAADIVDWLAAPIPGSDMGRHRFLRNGPGGLGRSVIAAVAYVLFNLVTLGALVFALSWPIGWVIGSDAVQPALRTLGDLPDRLTLPAELWLPGVIVMGAGLVVLAVSALRSYRLASLWKAAAGLFVIGLVLEVLLIGVPLAMVVVGRLLHGGTASARAAFVGTTALAGVAGTVWRLAAKPVTTRLASRLPELGGLLLAVVALVWGGKVATDAATGSGLFRAPITWLAVTAGFIAVYRLVGISGPTIHRIYRNGLRRSFGLARRPDRSLWAPPQTEQLQWADLPATEPGLIVCCAQQRTGIAPGGLPAETFTISRDEVRIADFVVDTPTYTARIPDHLASERYVASWIATSGAAFASAMGRLSKGSTNALLAALNIDLGIWLPNPRLVADRHTTFPKVRFGYLFKEILGWYDPADRYVFVADGGHWENLGLVELLRRRAATILCIDASGDQVGAFTTLRQAVELAGLELPDVVADIDLTSLDSIVSAGGNLPSGLVASLRVTYRGPGTTTSTGVIHYAKAQVASDLDVALRRFAKADRRFPNYSTGDQFLTDQQFSQLVALGRAAGERLAVLATDPPAATADLGDVVVTMPEGDPATSRS